MADQDRQQLREEIAQEKFDKVKVTGKAQLCQHGRPYGVPACMVFAELGPAGQ